MSSNNREPANRSLKRKASARRRSARHETQAGTAETLSASADDNIGSALSLAFAIELMGFGLCTLGDDYSKALVAVTHLLIGHLNAAQAACRLDRRDKRAGLGISHDPAKP